jgi:hypothetical protein
MIKHQPFIPDYILEGAPYNDEQRTPDYSVELKKDKPVIILEVGITQTLDELEERAQMWLIGQDVQLVILVDIKVDIAKDWSSLIKVSSFSQEEDMNAPPTLPYGLDMDFLKTQDRNAIASKIITWYEAQEPSIKPLVQLLLGTIYLYRHKPEDKSEIIPDETIVFFDSKLGHTTLEAYIKIEDFDITPSSISIDLHFSPHFSSHLTN